MSADVIPFKRNPVALLETPLKYMDALAIAEDALMSEGTKLPWILIRARVASALQRVDIASRVQSGVPELLAALDATLHQGHYAECLHGRRGGPPDDETRLGGARCSDVCVKVRKALARFNPEDDDIKDVIARFLEQGR